MSSFRKPVVGVRTDPGGYVDGGEIDGSITPLNFTSSVQPLSGNEQETLPEGYREGGAYRLYTDFKLRAVNQNTKDPGDKITLDGKDYLIIVVEPWQNNVIPHYKAIASEFND